jgi:hypothetical protein
VLYVSRTVPFWEFSGPESFFLGELLAGLKIPRENLVLSDAAPAKAEFSQKP